ncbi:MAG: seg [Parcubacteria group bacterium]|nr:seg [Parcubacteria group bacterium]
MEYQVPQFIEVEDKIFGPFTLKQFIYIAGGAGLCAVLVLYLPRLLGIILAIPVAALAGALAFYKINNKTFADILEAGFKYYIGGRLYLWKKEMQSNKSSMPVATPAAEPVRQKLGLTRGKLEELAWSLDIKDQQTPTE